MERQTETYWLSRELLLRALGAIYCIAFLSLAQQLLPLFGANGILPIADYLSALREQDADALWHTPSLFWVAQSDQILTITSWTGVGLSVAAILGFSNGLLFFLLWLLYLSFVNVGQIFYGYGWEVLLLEAGFLAIFCAPFFKVNHFSPTAPPLQLNSFLFRWLLFRVLFGAGLIKFRAADPCWRELSCLLYHYETQPLPNPLSWYLHNMPDAVHRIGVLVNHFAEIMLPCMLFCPRKLRHTAGVLSIVFQLLLIASGNLSWLNWLTIAITFACFDDSFMRQFASPETRQRLDQLSAGTPSKAQKLKGYALATLVALLSINPVANLLSSKQVMNTSFEPLHLVNTYGAFGTVGRQRYEVILEGTTEETITPNTQWREYQFKCKPGAVERRPCVIAPYQYRLDWQIWFAAMSKFDSQPWLKRLVGKLLEGNSEVLALLDRNPFPQGPPQFIRGRLYLYRFTRLDEHSRNWWHRRLVSEYFPPARLTVKPSGAAD